MCFPFSRCNFSKTTTMKIKVNIVIHSLLVSQVTCFGGTCARYNTLLLPPSLHSPSPSPSLLAPSPLFPTVFLSIFSLIPHPSFLLFFLLLFLRSFSLLSFSLLAVVFYSIPSGGGIFEYLNPYYWPNARATAGCAVLCTSFDWANKATIGFRFFSFLTLITKF